MEKSLVTSGQKAQLVRIVVDAVKKGAEMTINDLVDTEALKPDNFQKVLAQGNEVASSLIAKAKEIIVGLVENMASGGYLKCISTGKMLIIGEMDGKETLAEAKDVFSSWIDSDFKDWNLNVPSAQTEKTKIQVFEMIKDGIFSQLFGSFGENLDRLCLTQSQIKKFCKEHADWLRTGGYETFFIFKVRSEYFVAGVHVYSDGLGVYAFRLSDDDVWYAERRHRFVVSQL